MNVVLVFFMMTGSVWGTGRVTSEPADLAYLPLVPDAGCYQCRECGDDKHDIVNGTPPNNKHKSEHLEGCNAGDCDLHSKCAGEVEFALLEGVWDATRLADATTLHELLLTNGNAVQVNAARGAVQVLGCEQQVVLSIPVSQDIIQAMLGQIVEPSS